MSLLIRDGYTFNGHIEASGPWQALNFVYRPALADDVAEYLKGMDTRAGRGTVQAQAAFLAKHLVSWDVKEEDGSSAAIHKDVIKFLPHPILLQLMNIVMGYAGEQQQADAKN